MYHIKTNKRAYVAYFTMVEAQKSKKNDQITTTKYQQINKTGLSKRSASETLVGYEVA